MDESDVIRRALSTRLDVIIHYGEDRVELESREHECRKSIPVPKHLLPRVREFIMAPRPIEADEWKTIRKYVRSVVLAILVIDLGSSVSVERELKEELFKQLGAARARKE
jgi:hypothetical protein